MGKLDILFIVLLCLVCLTSVSGASSGHLFNGEEAEMYEPREQTITSAIGTVYNIEFDQVQGSITIKAENPTDEKINGGFDLMVDGVYFVSPDLKLSPNESRRFTWNIKSALNVVTDRHAIIFSTFGHDEANSTTFNFTQDINTSDPGPIPTPEITDVEITNGTIEGESSTVANVTISNPGIQLYGTKLMVHTLGTDGSFYGASVPPGESITITVELLDDQDAKIAGEARLYVHNLSKQDGAIDQVGFAGKVGEDTQMWNESYEPVRAPWRENSYQYTNESIEQEGPFERYTILGVPVVYVALALVALFVVFRKIR